MKKKINIALNLITGPCNHQLIDKNNISRNCKNKCKNNEKYCHTHLKLYVKEYPNNPIVTVQYLNENYIHNLMGLYDSWEEIDENNIICMDNEYWVIDIITSHFTQQLNNSNMENPYPIYPNSPFNRKLFSVDSLIILKNKILNLKMFINIALKLLLTQPINILQSIYNTVTINNFSEKMLELLQNNYRYMVTNFKNSQDVFTGLWVHKKMKPTQFEKLYEKLQNTPYQILVNGRVILNEDRNMIENKMQKCNISNNIFDKKVYEIL